MHIEHAQVSCGLLTDACTKQKDRQERQTDRQTDGRTDETETHNDTDHTRIYNSSVDQKVVGF